MTSYIISLIVAAAIILLAALISNAVKFEGGANPKDPGKRKMWFWIMAIINPIVYFLLGSFVLAPIKANDEILYNEYMTNVAIATALGFVVYIIIGFVLSKMFKHGKLGNWF